MHDAAPARRGTVSGGEQQMLAIARSLTAMWEILIIDELSLRLAPVVVQQLAETLKAIKAAGVTVMLVAQNCTQPWQSATMPTRLPKDGPISKRPAARAPPAQKFGRRISGFEFAAISA